MRTILNIFFNMFDVSKKNHAYILRFLQIITPHEVIKVKVKMEEMRKI